MARWNFTVRRVLFRVTSSTEPFLCFLLYSTVHVMSRGLRRMKNDRSHFPFRKLKDYTGRQWDKCLSAELGVYEHREAVRRSVPNPCVPSAVKTAGQKGFIDCVRGLRYLKLRMTSTFPICAPPPILRVTLYNTCVFSAVHLCYLPPCSVLSHPPFHLLGYTSDPCSGISCTRCSDTAPAWGQVKAAAGQKDKTARDIG